MVLNQHRTHPNNRPIQPPAQDEKIRMYYQVPRITNHSKDLAKLVFNTCWSGDRFTERWQTVQAFFNHQSNLCMHL